MATHYNQPKTPGQYGVQIGDEARPAETAGGARMDHIWGIRTTHREEVSGGVQSLIP
jgi:hypothetical protein